MTNPIFISLKYSSKLYRITAIYLILATSILFSCTQTAAPSNAIISAPKIVQMGQLIVNKKNKGEFTISNMGSTDLVIYRIIPDCSCTLIDAKEKQIIKAGSSLTYSFVLRPEIPGYIQQSIILDSNSKDKPKTLVLLRGYVKES